MQEESNYWGFWGTLLWGVIIACIIGVGQILPIFIYMLFSNDTLTLENFLALLENVETDAFLLSLSIIGSAFIVVPLVFVIAKLKRGSSLKEYFDLRAYSWKTFWSWMGILLLLLIFESFAIEALGAEEIPSFMMNIEYPNVSSMWLLVFAVTFMAPLVEEVVFRGFLLKGFSNSFMGVWGAVIVTSALWALVHLQYEFAYVAVIFVVGLVFGYARIVTNSLFVPMTMHFFMNLIASLGLFYEKGLV